MFGDNFFFFARGYVCKHFISESFTVWRWTELITMKWNPLETWVNFSPNIICKTQSFEIPRLLASVRLAGDWWLVLIWYDRKILLLIAVEQSELSVRFVSLGVNCWDEGGTSSTRHKRPASVGCSSVLGGVAIRARHQASGPSAEILFVRELVLHSSRLASGQQHDPPQISRGPRRQKRLLFLPQPANPFVAVRAMRPCTTGQTVAFRTRTNGCSHSRWAYVLISIIPCYFPKAVGT